MAQLLRVVVGSTLGLLTAVVVLFVGPNRQIVCGDGHSLDRLAQDVTRRLGGRHIDGDSASYCVVPDGGTWFLAAVALGALAGLGVVAAVRLPSKPQVGPVTEWDGVVRSQEGIAALLARWRQTVDDRDSP